MLLRELFSRRWWWKTVLALLAAVVCVRLGIWQLDRLAQRRAFNAHYLAMRAAEPLVLSAAAEADALTTMEYRAVQVSGEFDFDRQMLVINQYHDGENGYRLVTPLLLDDGTAVLVDRGWIPQMDTPTRDTLRTYDAPRRATVDGLIRLADRPPALGGNPDPPLTAGEPWRLRWRFLDPAAMQPQFPYRLLPIYVQAAPAADESGPPFAALPEIELTEGPHLGYAIQWFLFAVLALFAYPVMVWRQMRAEEVLS